MVRSKSSAPQKQNDPRAGAKEETAVAGNCITDTPLKLRVRGRFGVKAIDGLTASSTLETLRRKCDEVLGGSGIASLSFRGDDGANHVLIADGEWRFAGQIVIGRDINLHTMAITNGTLFNASTMSTSHSGWVSNQPARSSTTNRPRLPRS